MLLQAQRRERRDTMVRRKFAHLRTTVTYLSRSLRLHRNTGAWALFANPTLSAITVYAMHPANVRGINNFQLLKPHCPKSGACNEGYTGYQCTDVIITTGESISLISWLVAYFSNQQCMLFRHVISMWGSPSLQSTSSIFTLIHTYRAFWLWRKSCASFACRLSSLG